MKRWDAHVVCVGPCDGRKPRPWQLAHDPEAPLRKVLESLNWQVQHPADCWAAKGWGLDRVEAGRNVLEFIVSHHLPAFGGESKPLTPLVIISHKGGCDAVAHGLDWVDSGGLDDPVCPAWRAPLNQTEDDWLARRPVVWIAVSPKVREPMIMVYNSAVASLRQRNGTTYHGLEPYTRMPRMCLQVDEGPHHPLGWRPRQIADRAYSPALVLDERPRAFLRRADRHEELWQHVVRRVNEMFQGGRPVFPEKEAKG